MTGYTVIAGQMQKRKKVSEKLWLLLYKTRLRVGSSYATATADKLPAAVAVLPVDLLIDAVVFWFYHQ